MSESRNFVSNSLDAKSGVSVKSKSSERLCVNCANYAANDPKGVGEREAKFYGKICFRATGTANQVDGAPEYETLSASWERLGGWLAARLEGTCGKEGRFFRPIDESGKGKA